MSDECQTMDKKSIRYALGKHADAHGLACDCVGLANAQGGRILLGIEDDADLPHADQRVPAGLVDKLRKRIPQITVNVGIEIREVTAANGGSFLELLVFRNESSIASTSDGTYFLRIADETKRLLPDDLGRLWNDRGSFCWELQLNPALHSEQVDRQKQAEFCDLIRASDRVSAFLKTKSDEEILSHYLFVKDGCLTNLGVLWVGRRPDRAALQHAPVLQCLKYDESGRKVRKWSWDDYSLNPMELIAAAWNEIPDWLESHELPDGLFRKSVPHYDEVVVRELLTNALVHRPYTMRGDVFINLHLDRLEVHNPGLLPIGVTPANILHTSNQRNPHLARVFYDLKLMEKEGSGFDRMYETLLSSGRPAPEVREGDDRVVVTVTKKIIRPEILDFMFQLQRDFQPTQKEIIVLGLLAQHESLSAVQLASALDLPDASKMKIWLGRLLDRQLVKSQGKTKGAHYQVNPDLLRRTKFKGKTSLKRIEDHRLRELVIADLRIYQRASRAEIHQHIGMEIAVSKLRRMLQQLVSEGVVIPEGKNRGRKYLLSSTERIRENGQ
jgi:ATP-dependent DNA helicase RecG